MLIYKHEKSLNNFIFHKFLSLIPLFLVLFEQHFIKSSTVRLYLRQRKNPPLKNGKIQLDILKPASLRY